VTVAWQDVENAIAAFVAASGVVPSTHILWEREKKQITYGSTVELRISSENSLGSDDIEWIAVDVDVDDAPYVAPRVTGLREFVVSFRYRSRVQGDLYAARAALETLRASLEHPVRSELLSAAGIGYLATETLQTLDVEHEGRWESVAVLDVRFAVVSTLYSAASGSIADTVGTIGISQTGEPLIEISEGA
jgi:hypothetical protein